MSMGKLIQSMTENLETLKKINQSVAAVSIASDEILTAESATAKLREIFGKVYCTANLDVARHASGRIIRTLRVYVAGIGWSDDFQSYSEAIQSLVKKKDPADVLQSASEAVAEAVTPGVSPTVPLSDDEVRAAEEHQAYLDAAADVGGNKS